jgi:undecaprenyl-diphosphatase
MMCDGLFLSTMLDQLIAFDKQLLLQVNGSESLYLDHLVRILTTATTWIPLYLSLFYIVIRNNETALKIFLVLLGAGLCVLVAGALDDTFVKPTVARWRPTHDPEIGLLVDIVDGYRGGKYGFFSAHASNTFSIAIFFCWLVRNKLLSAAMIIWSLTNCYTRLYLGVHYPGDILVGLTWGFIVGTSVYFLIRRLTPGRIKYNPSDANIPVAVMVYTLIYALIKACFV